MCHSSFQGRNKSGQVGYFPESYVQISSSPPSTLSAANSVSDNLSADFALANEVPHVENKTSKYFKMNFLKRKHLKGGGKTAVSVTLCTVVPLCIQLYLYVHSCTSMYTSVPLCIQL